MKKQILTLTLSAFFTTTVYSAPGHTMGGHGDAHGTSQGHGMMDMGSHKSSVGEPAKTAEATQKVKVTLGDDMRIAFNEDLGSIKSGTVIQFIVKNDGKIPHEFSISSQEEQQAHAEMMRQMPDMKHTEGNTVTVDPGRLKFLTWRFEGNGTVVFSCNVPGHYEAGMHRSLSLIK
jgi:uncharacterized cupredoxin-like copper-binding protein